MPEAIVIDLAVVFVSICVSVFTLHTVCGFSLQLEDTDSSPDVPVEIEDNTATSQVHCFFVFFLLFFFIPLTLILQGSWKAGISNLNSRASILKTSHLNHLSPSQNDWTNRCALRRKETVAVSGV